MSVGSKVIVAGESAIVVEIRGDQVLVQWSNGGQDWYSKSECC